MENRFGVPDPEKGEINRPIHTGLTKKLKRGKEKIGRVGLINRAGGTLLKKNFVLLLVGAVFFLNGSRSPELADLVILNGKVLTADRDFSIAEAVAVVKNKIVKVGSVEDIKSFIGPGTKTIQLKGEVVLPGLIDAHAHLNSLGLQLTHFNISGENSFTGIVEKVAERVKTAKPGEWIIGGRWDHTRWPENKFPEHDMMSAVSPHNPVYLSRVDGNSAFVNEKAMQIAGITKDSKNPEGGIIHRKADGEPSGILINQAMNLVKNHFPEESRSQQKGRILKAIDTCIERGLTCIHEAGITPAEIDIYKELVDKGMLKLRVYAMLGDQEQPEIKGDLLEYFKKHRLKKYGDHFFSVRSIKLFFDGALGSRGAAFFTPYKDDPRNTGILRITPEYIYRVSQAALKADMSVCTHCIGIRGNRLCLESYRRALEENPRKDHRFRIEHAQIVRQEDAGLFAKLGVIPAMQPTHCSSDMTFIEERIGKERSTYSYAWRTFIDAGCRIPCGSDFPVESVNPFLGIYAGITRQDLFGKPDGGWHPEQRMTRQEAIRGFTGWAAFGGFQEKIIGSIEEGKLADFTIIDRDLLEIAPKEILKTRVLYTIVNGKIVFKR